MSNVTNTDPVVTESKLTEFYNDIKPFLGCPAYVTQEGDEMYYSTEEKVVGRWHDNKPIYQRTYIVSSGTYLITSNSWLTTNITIANVDKMLYGEAIDTTASAGHYITYPVYTCADTNRKLQLLQTRNISQEADIITIRYTKSTDSSVTTTEQKPTHYSTDEQVVGTWIDNRPIYQRTWLVKTPTTSATSQELATIGNDIDIAISVDGTLGNGVPINSSSYANYWTWIYVENGKLLGRALGWTNLDARITARYLKTSDL